MSLGTKVKKIISLAVLASFIASIPTATSALSPQATDTGTGFTAPISPLDGFSVPPGGFPWFLATYSPLTREGQEKDGVRVSVWKPRFAEVTGYPEDMSLLATVKLTGPAGTKIRTYVSNDVRTITLYLRNGRTTSVTLAPGVTSWSGTEIAFTGTMEAVNYMFSMMFIESGAQYGNGSLKYMVTTNENVAYNVVNDHFYKFVDWASPDSENVLGSADRTWTKALADASQYTFKGVQGHLATITSEEENTFVRDRLGTARNVFLAGSDKDREGQWKWYAGPEEGQVFWEARCAATDSCDGEAAYNDRTPAINTFSAWATSAEKPDDPNENEPNDWGAGAGNVEDYLVTNRYVDGKETQDPRWNDLPIGGNFIGGYVVEFSGAVANFSGVHVREIPFQVGPGRMEINATRVSRSEVKVKGKIIGAKAGDVVELERKVGKGKYTVIASKKIKGSNFPSTVEFSVKMTDAVNTQETQYRLLMRKIPNLKDEYRSSAVAIEALTLPPATTAIGKLKIAIGQHITDLKAGLFSAKGLKPLSKFKIVLRSDPVVLLNEQVGYNGEISASVHLPEDTEPGNHTVTITGTGRDGKAVKSVATFTLDEDGVVTAFADTNAAITELPATGNDIGRLPWFATLLIVLGGAFTAMRRRRVA